MERSLLTQAAVSTLSSKTQASSFFYFNPIGQSLFLPSIRSFPLVRSNREKSLVRMTVSGNSSETVEIGSSDMIFQQILEHGVFRFDCSVEHRKAAFPSVSFKNSKDRELPIASQNVPAYIPTCACLQDQQVVTFEFSPGTSFYGTGEVSGQLERTGKRVFTWNTDAWGYGSGTTSLYQSHPWVLVVLSNGETLGVLADTTRKCEIDLRKEGSIRIIAPSSYPIITFGPFSSPTAVLESLSHAIGTVFMPPKWALGYHQCRWSYMSHKRVAEIAQTFRDKKIPSDVIWMDIDYMDGFRCFTFDKERFPDPCALAKDLHNNGFKAIWMLDPGIKQEEGYDVYDSGNKNDLWVSRADGKPFIGEVWPGPCAFPDYTNSKTRTWWANLVKEFVSNGVDGIWNDMNEPAVFKVVTKTMPENNIHRGDDELGGVQNHSHYHNVTFFSIIISKVPLYMFGVILLMKICCGCLDYHRSRVVLYMYIQIWSDRHIRLLLLLVFVWLSVTALKISISFQKAFYESLSASKRSTGC